MTTPIQPALQPDVEADFLLNGGAPFSLDCGATLPQVTLRYVLYGKLNAERDNAILVCHGLSGSASVADWWQEMFLNDHPLNPKTHCIIGINALGSCYGSTGPTSINPATGTHYGIDFPVVSIRDIVRGQAQLMDHLGIAKLRAVIGPSIGGMQALQWAVDFPDRVANCFATGATPLTAMGLALNHLQRQSIRLDPAWKGGKYSLDQQPAGGLSLARGIASCTYKSPELFTERFGRRPNRSGDEDPTLSHQARYDVAGYLDYQGRIFIDRFDANSYIAITRAMDNFDLARGYENEAAALRRIKARVLLAGISSDWLFTAPDIRALADRCRRAGVRCDYIEVQSHHGHDAFLAEAKSWRPFVEYITRDPQHPYKDFKSTESVAK